MESTQLLAFIGGILLSVMITAFLYRLKEGDYKVVGTTSNASMFETSIGEFRLDKKHARLQVKTDEHNWAAVPFSDIRALSFERTEDDAMLLEWLTGFNLWDLSGKYRDQVITCTIDVVQADGTSISVYKASQFEEREFWVWGMWARATRKMLEFVKLNTNIDTHSEHVYNNLQQEFRRHGLAV